VLSAGTHTLHADFTPTDAANYTNATADVTINVSENPEPVLPVANFTANKTEGTIPLTVKFTDTSNNSPTGWKWNFGDNNTSNDANPSHTYATAGKFIANLTVSNVDDTDTASKTITAFEAVLGTPKASFTVTPQTGRVPLTVKFTDKSTNATSLTWDFGDKTAISTESNPSHIYKAAGFFTVKLTATNGNKSSVASKLIIAA
jgi:PKD repeat protein